MFAYYVIIMLSLQALDNYRCNCNKCIRYFDQYLIFDQYFSIILSNIIYYAPIEKLLPRVKNILLREREKKNHFFWLQKYISVNYRYRIDRIRHNIDTVQSINISEFQNVHFISRKNAANGLAKGFLSNKYLPPKKNLI